jgi:hypothetical protein
MNESDLIEYKQINRQISTMSREELIDCLSKTIDEYEKEIQEIREETFEEYEKEIEELRTKLKEQTK